MTRHGFIFVGLLLSATLATAAPASNTPLYAPSAAVSGAQCAISAAKAGQIASKLYGGKVIDVKLVNLQGRSLFRVKLLQPNGRIHSVLIDANNGQPLQ